MISSSSSQGCSSEDPWDENKTLWLFHGTTPTAVERILQQGFDEEAPRAGACFGKQWAISDGYTKFGINKEEGDEKFSETFKTLIDWKSVVLSQEVDEQHDEEDDDANSSNGEGRVRVMMVFRLAKTDRELRVAANADYPRGLHMSAEVANRYVKPAFLIVYEKISSAGRS